MSPKILLEKNKERKNRKSEEKKKKIGGCTLKFYVHCFGGESFILAVKLFKNRGRYVFFFPCG